MDHKATRRNFFTSAAGAAVPAIGSAKAVSAAASNVAGTLNLDVVQIERAWVRLPFRPVPARNMIRELPHWTDFEICRVKLACGVTGFGETMAFYTWQRVTDEAIRRVQGRNATEHMWDDSIGCGLQMAVMDAVARAMNVPLYRLLGRKCRDRAPISWWAIDMPGADWLLESKQALSEGYTDFKTKARPWFDLKEQCSMLSKALPPFFRFDFDFNSMLLDGGRAIRYLPEIESFPQVAVFETPIPQDDIAGNKLIRSHVNVPIAMHYGAPPVMTALREDVCDVFVIGGGASRVIDNGTVAATAGKPFWLQLVGTGITAAFSLHFGAVLTHARLPAVNCHQLYTEQMIRPLIPVENGFAKIPEAPGLGVELNLEALERFRIEPVASEPYPAPNLLLAIRWPSGATSYYAHARQYWDDFLNGRLPIFPQGVYLESIPDNGSRQWRELQSRAAKGGVQTPNRPL